jgi:hypothetical protein
MRLRAVHVRGVGRLRLRRKRSFASISKEAGALDLLQALAPVAGRVPLPT